MTNSTPHSGVLCPACKKRMFSYHVHDYRLCGCENETMIDGGKEYLRYGWRTTKPEVIDWDEKLDRRKDVCPKPPSPLVSRKRKKNTS